MDNSRGMSLLPAIAVMGVVVITAVFALRQVNSGTSQTDVAPVLTTQSPPTPSVTFEYSVTDTGDPSMQMTTATAYVNGVRKVSITTPGSCRQIGATGGIDGKGLLPNEIAATQCWFGGGGNELGIFVENGMISIKKGILGEGAPGIPFFRGDFVTLVTIDPTVLEQP